MRTAVASTHVDLTPGVPTKVEIEVTNTAEVIDGITLIVDGLDPDWVRQDVPVVSLFPNDTAKISFVVDVPRSCLAGNYLVVVQVVSTIDAERHSVHDLWLSVAPQRAVAVRAVPAIISRGRRARTTVSVANTGNITTEFALSAVDQERELDCLFEPEVLTVPPGQTHTTKLRMTGPRPWFGNAATRIVTVTAASGDASDELQVTFRQKPRIPRGVLTLLILAGIIALWAAIFFWVITQIGKSDVHSKSAASSPDENGEEQSELFTGESSVPLAEIGATATGSVTAASDGSPVPSVAVEAYRVSPDSASAPSSFRLADSGDAADTDGAGDRLVAAAATDEDGTFTIDRLLPGTYRFVYTVQGFATVDDVTVQLGAAETRDGLDVVLAGDTATVTGSISAPDGGDASRFEIAATLLVDGEESPPLSSVEPGPVAADGSFELTGLVAPGTHRVRVTDTLDQLAPLEFEVTVGGGAITQLNPVQPTADPGSIQGRSVDARGNPIGDVSVVVSSGTFRRELTTPTTGSTGVGMFVVTGLPNPGDYTVTFSKDGYSSYTAAVRIDTETPTADVVALMIGGLGNIQGRVTDPDGTALGGAEVTVTGNSVVAVSSTLTSGTPGAFDVSSLPVPGDYVVSVSLDGYVGQTFAVELTASAPQSISTSAIVLQPVPVSVRGTVELVAPDSVDREDTMQSLQVRLDDGRTTRRATPVTEPFGAFSFDGVAPGTYTLSVVDLDGDEEDPPLVVHLVRLTAGNDIDVTLTVVIDATSAPAETTTTVAPTTAPATAPPTSAAALPPTSAPPATTPPTSAPALSAPGSTVATGTTTTMPAVVP